ncbi:MAG: hypothetical protein V3T83_14670, partial [Acidobacteriota bacterium]
DDDEAYHLIRLDDSEKALEVMDFVTTIVDISALHAAIQAGTGDTVLEKMVFTELVRLRDIDVQERFTHLSEKAKGISPRLGEEKERLPDVARSIAAEASPERFRLFLENEALFPEGSEDEAAIEFAEKAFQKELEDDPRKEEFVKRQKLISRLDEERNIAIFGRMRWGKGYGWKNLYDRFRREIKTIVFSIAIKMREEVAPSRGHGLAVGARSSAEDELGIRTRDECQTIVDASTQDRFRLNENQAAFVRELLDRHPDPVLGKASLEKILSGQQVDADNPSQLFKSTKGGKGFYKEFIQSNHKGHYWLERRVEK